jgi:hypothetical protein
MTPVCRPTPFVRFMPMSETRAQKSTHALHGTTLAHGSIFTSGPTPENPPKRSSVENVQKNYLSLLSEPAKSGNADNCLRAARLSSPWLKPGAFRRDLVKGSETDLCTKQQLDVTTSCVFNDRNSGAFREFELCIEIPWCLEREKKDAQKAKKECSWWGLSLSAQE